MSWTFMTTVPRCRSPADPAMSAMPQRYPAIRELGGLPPYISRCLRTQDDVHDQQRGGGGAQHEGDDVDDALEVGDGREAGLEGQREGVPADAAVRWPRRPPAASPGTP